MKATGLPEASVLVCPSFHDVDPMNVVWHGNYLKYFEKAREALFRKLNYGYAEMLATGYIWPIVQVEVKYKAPLLVESEATVLARILEYENRLVIGYEVITPEGRVITQGKTVQMAMDVKTRTGQFSSPKVLFEKLGKECPW